MVRFYKEPRKLVEPIRGSLKYDTNYSQYDKKRTFKNCQYCGEVLISRTTRNRHKRLFHEKELIRY